MDLPTNIKLARETSKVVNDDLYEVKCYKNGELDKEFSLPAQNLPDPALAVSEIVLRADLTFRVLTEEELAALDNETEGD